MFKPIIIANPLLAVAAIVGKVIVEKALEAMFEDKK